jgi:hypothetical protein
MTDQYRKDIDYITEEISRLSNRMGCQGRLTQRVLQLAWDIEMKGVSQIKSDKGYEYDYMVEVVEELGQNLINLGHFCVDLSSKMERGEE